MKHLITSVDRDSLAQELGIEAGTYLLTINSQEIVDIIDYEQLVCTEHMLAEFLTPDGEIIEADITKDMYAPLGLNFDSSLMSPIRQCKNHCIFCFIDQMHTGGRKTLHFKDDDWRLSLIMGNYVTLTNVDDDEFERIIKRRACPLYVSVHSTDGEIRKTMMANPTATRIMDRLTRLKNEGLMFHSQIVLCPDINDGDVLYKSIMDLYSLSPAAQSVAVVPVGLTQFREGLYPLRCLTRKEAMDTIAMIEKLQEKFLSECGSRFVFPSDEMYLMAGMYLPPEENYEDYPQLENGVGLLRKFEFEFLSAMEEMETDIKIAVKNRHIQLHGAVGVSAYDFLQKMYANLKPLGIDIVLHPIENDFFGHTVTVSGLVCATDIINQLSGKDIRHLMIPHTMLRENSDVFLDNQRTGVLEEKLNCQVHVMPCYDGGEFLDTLINIIREVII